MRIETIGEELDITLVNSGLGNYHKEGVKELLYKVLPCERSFSNDSFEMQEKLAEIIEGSLPLLKWIQDEETNTLSVVLFSTYRLGAANFFYHMISKWLIPFQQIPIDLFFTADFSLPQITNEQFSVAEITIRAKSLSQWNEMKKSIHSLDTEIRLGVLSSYHANRILEFKGLAMDRKTSMIQEKIGSLIRNKDFDKSIFSQMQRFLVNCNEAFKEERGYHHISRIISVFHLIRKMLMHKVEVLPQERHLTVKFLKAKLAQGEKERKVLGISVGLNFLQEHEKFQPSDLVRIIKRYLPSAKEIKNSFFVDRLTESAIQILYLEIEKEDGADFTQQEVQLLRSALPECLKDSIRSLTHPVFMPRNEEEILRNIMTLSSQLRYVKDLPQVIIKFDEQKAGELEFSVIVLRIINPQKTPSDQLVKVVPKKWKAILESSKKIGVLRRKYAKEASIFRVYLPIHDFLRLDQTIDIFQARKAILTTLIEAYGEVRDYNGGIFHKETEILHSLKNSLSVLGEVNEILIEKFFYSIQPASKRCTLPIEPLKTSFLLFLQLLKKEKMSGSSENEALFKVDGKYGFAIFSTKDPLKKMNVKRELQQLSLSSHEKVILEYEHFSGCILLTEDKFLQKQILERLEKSFYF